MAAAGPRQPHARPVRRVPVGVADIEPLEDALRARSRSRVNTAAPRPNSVSSMRATGLVVVADARDADHGPEALLAHERHAVVDVDQHRRLEPVARPRRCGRRRTSTRAPFATASRDLRVEHVELRGPGERADVGAVVARDRRRGTPSTTSTSVSMNASARSRRARRPARSRCTTARRCRTRPRRPRAPRPRRRRRRTRTPRPCRPARAARGSSRSAAAARDLPAGRVRAGEAHHVDVGVDERGAGRARRRRPRARRRRGRPARCSRSTRRRPVSVACSDGLYSTALPGEQRGHDRVERRRSTGSSTRSRARRRRPART